MDIATAVGNVKTKLRKLPQAIGAEATRRAALYTPYVTGKLQNGWGFEFKDSTVTIYNVVEYASHVNYGTPFMEARGMTMRVRLEFQQIVDVAAQQVGIKQ